MQWPAKGSGQQQLGDYGGEGGDGNEGGESRGGGDGGDGETAGDGGKGEMVMGEGKVYVPLDSCSNSQVGSRGASSPSHRGGGACEQAVV